MPSSAGTSEPIRTNHDQASRAAFLAHACETPHADDHRRSQFVSSCYPVCTYLRARFAHGKASKVVVHKFNARLGLRPTKLNDARPRFASVCHAPWNGPPRAFRRTADGVADPRYPFTSSTAT